MAHVLVLQHFRRETLGTIGEVLAEHGIEPRYVRTFAGEPVPDELGDAAGLIAMGGPQAVYEQDLYPYLTAELRLLERAVRDDRPVLGVCLGSQLLAAALGVPVTKGPRKEIGWYPVTLAPPAADDPLFAGVPATFTAFHWHGDVFALPPRATTLASSDLTACQAFRHASAVYGFLFHMEVTPEIVAGMARSFTGETAQEGLDGHQIVAQTGAYLPQLSEIGRTIFGRWVERLPR